MFIIRADGNAKIGAGHLMRCLTIAEALREALSKENKNAAADDILFVCADRDSARLAEERGFTARALDTDYRKMERELPEWEKMYEEFEKGKGHNDKNKIPSVILIDSYHVTDSYLIRLKKRMTGYTLVLLDDMQEHAYPADVVVNYNVFADREVYDKLYASKQNKVRLFLGNRYVPVRKQFLDKPYRVADKVKRVLITTGGGDSDNIAGSILEALLEAEKMEENAEKFNYDLILGRFYPKLQEMQEFAAGCSRIHIHHDVRDMAALMENCDLAVTAGGSTIYELAAVGVPLICFSYAKNQELMTEYIGREQIAGFAGAYHKDADAAITGIKRLFTEFCQNTAKRNGCYLKERQMVDGLGAMRLVQEVLLGINT
ncbi:MAG: UDP-2,4-diacetamido-2,4,6-trideoxy-beta-L-altropyranose hydrolase [Lachnoclostridium sp.]|nr:UDP-2,4-diacetamido-2,4,6-trideoxy-beta-L-altropyranose hydrolase [Lachnospira sp.]MCM1247805.1 UDP-2,4-diacetamido-2,4,6-trideoxy-beta-L-altropyranose hydrolase [Lachnoclostridium sp.]MCM1534339.1 UDP-2,4-diacetamido-2,4,6-trideoxy-beta-L-altropyranose hydrolase [Clostridium sp.]